MKTLTTPRRRTQNSARRTTYSTAARGCAELLLGACLAAGGLTHAAAVAAEEGRLIGTGGVTEIEGSAGGGIVPWAVVAGYGTRDQVDATAFYTYLSIKDFRLQSGGLAVGVFDRVELSYALQRLDLGSTVPGRSIEQDVFGAKVKLYGDAVYDQDMPWPQIAAGVQYKKNRDFDLVPRALGAKHDAGTDVYLSATKLYLAGIAGRNVLVNTTLRETEANQLGLLGFGGDLNSRMSPHFEGSAAVFITDRLAAGVEYRSKPNNLSAYREDSFDDVFLAWFPDKHLSITAAWAELGRIADKTNQDGVYLSLQLAY